MMTQQVDFAKRSVRASQLGRWALRLAIGALAVAGIGLTLARYDLIAKLQGFSALLAGGALALLALILALAAFIFGRRVGFDSRRQALGGLILSLVFVGFLASRPLAAGNAPAIHDISTDLANPPQFETLTVRADNLVGVGTVENWRKVHAAAYGDLGPIVIAKPAATVAADALRLAQDAGWAIAASDLARGHIEATASVSYIRFQDDLVIRIVPSADGQTRVDMRSVSRIGVSDLGVNAQRIRAFLTALAAA